MPLRGHVHQDPAGTSHLDPLLDFHLPGPMQAVLHQVAAQRPGCAASRRIFVIDGQQAGTCRRRALRCLDCKDIRPSGSDRIQNVGQQVTMAAGAPQSIERGQRHHKVIEAGGDNLCRQARRQILF